jgi:hypothetical protein
MLLIALGALLVLGALLLGAWQLAARELQSQLLQALGPRASVQALALTATGVQVRGLRIAAAPGWPAGDELRAERVHLRPSLGSLWRGAASGQWRIERVEVSQAYVSLLRTREGRLRVLPALLERAPAPASTTAPAVDAAKPGPGVAVHLAEIVLREAAIDLFDASLKRGTHRVQLQDLQAELGPLDVPALDSRTVVKLRAQLKGPQRNGQLAIDGEVNFASRDADLQASAQGVDLVALQPYLLKVNEGGVKRGTLDLAVHAQVKQQRLHAPGQLTLTGLELASGGGVLGTFAGLPRQAVLAAMQRDGRISVKFALEGRLDDPSFSLNDNLAARLTGGLAETLGVSLGGVVEGVGNLVKGLFGR